MSNYTMSPVVNGEKKQMIVKVGDTLPIGTEIDYDGSVVPNGWEKVENVLWENTSPTSEFAGQQVTLNDSIANYSYYEVIFRRSTTSDYLQSTGKIPVDNQGVLQQITALSQKREVSISTNQATFTDGFYYGTYGTGTTTTQNSIIIPIKIIGYKKQIKKIAPVTPANGNIENSYGTSQTDTYSQEYINKFTDYSTTEQVIGKWIDGKPLYRQVISMGALPSTGYLSRNVSSLNIDTSVSMNGFIYNDVKTTAPIPASGISGGNIACDVYNWQNKILTIYPHGDLSSYTHSYIILEYTKTTD